MNLPYLAGFADGEGCIMMVRRKDSRPTFVFAVVNTDKRPLLEFRRRWGGIISQLVERRPRREPRIIYRWQTASWRARDAVLELQPHFVVKKEQAALWLKSYAEITGRARGDRNKRREEWLMNKLSWMKRR